MTKRDLRAPRRLSQVEAARRSRRGSDVPGQEAAIRQDIAVHDAVRLLGLEPATGPGRGYDARGPEFRYRIAGCASADSALAPGAFRSGHWDRGLLVSMTAELEPLAIHELTIEAAIEAGRSIRSVAGLRKNARTRWTRE